jgi:signal transduction histidine kinase
MNKFFRQLSLPVKLLLLILFPLALLVFLAIQLYREKSANADLVHSYIDRLNRSVDISELISDLQSERKTSYNYVLTKDDTSKLNTLRQRILTDAAIKQLDNHQGDLTLKDYKSYTFLDSLAVTRRKVDNGMQADQVMHYYTTSIFRLHTLNTVLAGNNKYLNPIFADVTAEKLLDEMVTYLEIISANFYNALYTRQNNILMLYGLMGVHDVFKSYEKELLTKAPPKVLDQYTTIRNKAPLSETLRYIDHIFSVFSFDTLYNAETWWNVSGAASDELKMMKKQLLLQTQARMNTLLKQELRNRDITFFLLIIALVFVFALMLYTTHIITQMLTRLNVAAQKIARGGTGVGLQPVSVDVIGSLSESISRIDENNKTLAEAADSIGKGNFNVPIHARSVEDTLGNAVIRMRDNLRRYEQRKDDFIKMASHELKTPVTTIKGYVQLLQTRVQDKDLFLADSLATIDRQVSKLTKLIIDLLDATRIETGQLPIRKESFHINEVLNALAKDVGTVSTSHKIVMHQYADALVHADKDRIAQVFSNLVDNAIKYSPGSSSIIIDVNADDDMVTVAIKDSGIGIAAGEEDKIFERFYRVNGHSESTYPGFGIGLYIVKEIVSLHYGNVWVKSEKGKGSTFFVSLPVYK